MKRKYFGTDGIRGKVGEPPISADFMLKLGWAAGRVLPTEGRNTVIIGKDTRISGYMFESALEAGLIAAGVDIVRLGPTPTPAIAYLTRTLRACAGIVISASHNPHHDNGIKFFSKEGVKISDALEDAIEQSLELPLQTVPSEKLGKATVLDAEGRYIEFCKHAISAPLILKGMKIVIDCANGATYKVAPSVFEELGAKVIRIGNEPNGLNINVACGSTHPEKLQQKVLEEQADIGIALDGDGDRVIMVDEKGDLVDGDEMVFIIANGRKSRGSLEGPVVGTLMSNLGMEVALRQKGIPFMRAQVGDRFVLEMLRENGGLIGGESSGHILCLDRTTTGDGIISALQIVELMVVRGTPLSELKQGMDKFPQKMINVRVKDNRRIKEAEAVWKAVAEVEKLLGTRGRVLLRPSGTEPLVRVMVEGEDAKEIDECAVRLAEVVSASLS